ncbi:hypothetical protein ABXL46_07400 [Yersinia enterocolitica]|uniref:hypothetical protein n=1 Tax=Yersinia enterocolitica TaxID=630 RepID=UPI00338FAB37
MTNNTIGRNNKGGQSRPEVADKPTLLHRDWRVDCTDGRSGGARRYDPFGTFPRPATLSTG